MKEVSIKKAALINGGANYACVLLQVLFSTVLARLLTPEDYGIISVVTVFTTFFSVLANMGIGTAVIQNKKLDDNDISNIFTFNIYAAVLLAAVFALFSFPMSHFYGNDVYRPIGMILSVSLFFSTMNMVPNALLMKEKRFVRIGVRMVTVTTLSSLVAVGLAFLGFKYYALAAQSVMSAAANFIWNYSSVRVKPKLKCDLRSIRKIFVFSSYQFAFNVFNYFARNADKLLISKFMGSAQLGYYDKAYKLALYPEQNLTHVITPVLHPILSDYQNDKKYIYEKYMPVVKILSLLGLFVGIYMYFSSREIIYIMFGRNWNGAIPCIQMLSLSVWAQVVNSSSGAIYQSLGNTRNMFIAGVLSSLCTLTGIVLGLVEGSISAVARNAMISYNINFFISYFILVKKTFGFRLRDFLKSFVPDLGVAAAVALAGIAAMHIQYPATDIFGILINAGIKLAVMGAAYAAALFVLGQHKYFLSLIKRKK